MPERLRVIVSGMIAQYPLGGMAWHYLQYVLGLRELGHDVYYLEDTAAWPYDAASGRLAEEPDRNVGYLAALMARFGMADRWAYRVRSGGEAWWFGMSDSRRRDVVASADVLLDVSGALDRPEDYRGAGRLVFIDTDPGFVQLRLQRGEARERERVSAHDVHFSFGERMPGTLPDGGVRWLPTRQPILLSAWRTEEAPRPVYTTVMNWSSYQVERWRGRRYGQKNVEFLRCVSLPRRLPGVRFEIACAHGPGRVAPLTLLERNGWQVVDPTTACPDLDGYRRYVQRSRAEWSVAKNAYVRGRTAWFSERSACYLAAGRPVVVQDTGFSEVLSVGLGIVPFTTPAEAVEAVRSVEADYARHAHAAHEIAREYFASGVVLRSLLERAGG